MNFALMFALALGIDYALFLLVRFRASLLGSHLTKEESVAVTMDTAGKAVLFSGVTVLISLSAVMLVPSPAFRSMALGIMIAVAFILVATLTLFPAVLGLLGDKVNRLSLPWVHHGEHRSAKFAAWGERLWKQPLRWGVPAVALLVVLAIPVFGLNTGMPSIKVVPTDDPSRVGYEQVQQAMGTGAPGMLHIVGPTRLMADASTVAAADPGIAVAMPAQAGDAGYSLVQAMPKLDPSDPALGDTIDRIRESVAQPRRTTTWRRRSWVPPRSRSVWCWRSVSCCCSSRCRRRSSRRSGY
jgi:RND superfamily putative drug exporter